MGIYSMVEAMDAPAYSCLKILVMKITILQFAPFCLELLFFVNIVLAICHMFTK